MKVGDKVVRETVRAVAGNGTKEQLIQKTGVVIWLHPKGRFHRVYFEFGPGRGYTESYISE